MAGGSNVWWYVFVSMEVNVTFSEDEPTIYAI